MNTIIILIQGKKICSVPLGFKKEVSFFNRPVAVSVLQGRRKRNKHDENGKRVSEASLQTGSA
jgi:hypothetical protein